jgi:hypothetical protein
MIIRDQIGAINLNVWYELVDSPMANPSAIVRINEYSLSAARSQSQKHRITKNGGSIDPS